MNRSTWGEEKSEQIYMWEDKLGHIYCAWGTRSLDRSITGEKELIYIFRGGEGGRNEPIGRLHCSHSVLVFFSFSQC